MVGVIMIGGQCNNFQERQDGVAKEWTLSLRSALCTGGSGLVIIIKLDN